MAHSSRHLSYSINLIILISQQEFKINEKARIEISLIKMNLLSSKTYFTYQTYLCVRECLFVCFCVLLSAFHSTVHVCVCACSLCCPDRRNKVDILR